MSSTRTTSRSWASRRGRPQARSSPARTDSRSQRRWCVPRRRPARLPDRLRIERLVERVPDEVDADEDHDEDETREEPRPPAVLHRGDVRVRGEAEIELRRVGDEVAE